jgi:hypothetical protein
MGMGMGMGIRCGVLLAVSIGAGGYFDRHDHKPSVTDAAFGHDMIGEMPDLGFCAAQHSHFKAGIVIEMNMQGRDGEIVAMVLGARQSFGERARFMVENIDERGDTGAFATLAARLLQAGAGQVAQSFRPVLIAARLLELVDFGDQVVVEGDGHALHLSDSASEEAGL